MSGDRHHIIPKFLQKNFLCLERRKGNITNVYRKNGHNFSSNIINTNVENKFYTSESIDADEKLTKEENLICDILREEEYISKEMALVIAHFEIRTKNLRSMFTSTIDDMLSIAFKKISNAHYLENLLKTYFRNNPRIIEEEFGKIEGSHTFPPKLKKKLIKSAKKGENKAISHFVNSYLSTAYSQLSAYSSEIERSVKDGHLKILKDISSVETRAKKYEQYHYSCYEVEDSSMILGDSIVVFETFSEGRTKWKQFTDKNDKILSIIMPLASNKIIIGTTRKITSYKPDITIIKLAIAQCSLEQFISSKKSDDNLELAKHIGTISSPLTQAEIDSIVTEGFEKAVLKRN